jgi:hypothetical protein
MSPGCPLSLPKIMSGCTGRVVWAGQDGNSGDPAGPFGPSVANKVLSDSSVDKAAVKYQAYSSAMPFAANSFFAFSFLARCIRPMPRSTLGALVN